MKIFKEARHQEATITRPAISWYCPSVRRRNYDAGHADNTGIGPCQRKLIKLHIQAIAATTQEASNE
jgi:hypothetical protein